MRSPKIPLSPEEWLAPTSRALRAALFDQRRLPLAASHLAGVRRDLARMVESGALTDDDADPLIASNKLRLLELIAEAQEVAEVYERLWGAAATPPAPAPEAPQAPEPEKTEPEEPSKTSPAVAISLPPVAAAPIDPPDAEMAPPASTTAPQSDAIDAPRLLDLLESGLSGDGRTPFIVARTGPQSVYRLLRTEFDLDEDACDRLLRRLADQKDIAIEPRGLPPDGRVRSIIRVNRNRKR